MISKGGPCGLPCVGGDKPFIPQRMSRLSENSKNWSFLKLVIFLLKAETFTFRTASQSLRAVRKLPLLACSGHTRLLYLISHEGEI